MARTRSGKATSESSGPGGASARQPRPRPVSGKPKVEKQGTYSKGVRAGRASQFFQEMVAELRKVTWPTRPQLLQATAVVVVFLIIMTAYLAGLDAVFSRVVDAIF